MNPTEKAAIQQILNQLLQQVEGLIVRQDALEGLMIARNLCAAGERNQYDARYQLAALNDLAGVRMLVNGL